MSADRWRVLARKLATQAVIGGAVVLGMATGCKAQECTPDHFTETGVETHGGVVPRSNKPIADARKNAASASQGANSGATSVTTKAVKHPRRRKSNSATGG
jgi:hypothetical protein